MRDTVVLVLVVALAMGGCLGDPGESPTDRREGSAGDPPGQTPSFSPAVNVSKEHPGAEPVVDVASDGTIFVQGQGFEEAPRGDDLLYPGERTQNRVWRSTDGGQTWTDVSPPGRGRNSSCDAYMAVAPDDTVYAANCFIVGFPGPTEMALFRSEDRGETWTELVDPPFPPDVHRMWLVPEGNDTLHVAVESQYPTPGGYYLVTHDRGETWQGPFPMDQETIWGSELAVDGERGLLYAARLAFEPVVGDTEDGINHTGPFYLRVSDDGGHTWDRRRVAQLDGPFATQAWQPLTIDDEGTLYLVWAEGERGRGVVHYAYSTDQGESWQSPIALTEIPGTQTLVWAQAQAPGRLGLTFYHAQQAGLPDELNASWHAGYAVVEQADTADPTVRTERLTDWPVHTGNICTEGGSCREEGEDRRLLEFTGVQFGPDGRAHTAFASTQWEGHHGFPLYVGQTPDNARERRNEQAADAPARDLSPEVPLGDQAFDRPST